MWFRSLIVDRLRCSSRLRADGSCLPLGSPPWLPPLAPSPLAARFLCSHSCPEHEWRLFASGSLLTLRDYPRLPEIARYYPSVRLRLAPHDAISPYLPISPRISPYLLRLAPHAARLLRVRLAQLRSSRDAAEIRPRSGPGASESALVESALVNSACQNSARLTPSSRGCHCLSASVSVPPV